jgi:hypothetical protein
MVLIEMMQRFASYGADVIAAVELLATGTCIWAIVMSKKKYQSLRGEQLEGLRHR